MKNILIFKFPYSSLFGGGERHTLTLVQELQKKDFRFYLVSSCRVLLREFRKRHWHARKMWLGKEPVSQGAILFFPFLAPFLGLKILVTVIYYRFWKNVSTLYCLQLTEKILATVPARLLGMRVFWVEHVTIDRWLTLNPLRVFYRMFARFAKIVVISEAIKKQLVNMGVAEKRIARIYPGIDTRQFTKKTIYWEHPDRFIIGVVARLVKEKGIEFFLHALNIVREFIPGARAIIVGDGPEREKLQWLARHLGLKEHVQWVGYQHEVERWYNYFDVFVLPSVGRESFGIALVEAMAAGVPVIASKLGGTIEIIDDHRTGLLAASGSSQSLADCIMAMYNNRGQTREMINAASQKVEHVFSLEKMVRDFYLLFRK